MGVTTPMFPNENCPQGDCTLLNNTALPPKPNDATNDASLPQLPLTAQAQQGAALFSRIGCTNCHLPSLTTGPNISAALNNATFFPFSDFLLHNMGSGGDGIAQANAGPQEIRTTPLWGVRLQQTLLHDGSAKNIPQAIMAHRGQRQAASDAFARLNHGQQTALVAFLKSL
jgi:CxxC motif-containing protein (DUF1111 family)